MRAVWGLRPLLRPYRRVLLIGSLLAVGEVLMTLAQPWPLRVIVDDVLTPGGPSSGDEGLLLTAIALLVVLVTTCALLDYWSTRILTGAGLQLGNDLRDQVFTHLHRLSLRFHGEHQVGDLSTRITGDVDRTQDMIVQTLALFIPKGMLLVGMFAVMMWFDPWFTLLALAAVPLTAFAVHRATVQLKVASRRARKADGAVAAAATESLGSMQLVQAFALEDRQRASFGDLRSTSLGAGLDAARLQARFSPLVDLSGVVSTAVVLWFGAQRVLDGKLTLGVLLVFLTYLGTLYKPLKALSKLSTIATKGAAAAERIAEVLQEAPAITDRPWATAVNRCRGELSFESVSFSYGREPVLRDIDLSVGAGETLALVGSTGAGKTTLASLIPRLIDPTKGVVRLDGEDLRDLALASLRPQVSLVLQDCLLLRGTLRDNIACGRPSASDAEVAQAVRLALVDEFSCRLPDGLESYIGERGANLSAGQRQRVAIARAILRASPILVLDEPTSALDAASEALVLEALENLPAGRTTVVIAHRLSTVRRADRIVVLEEGQIAEQGDHDQLVAQGGRYRQLLDLQLGRASRDLLAGSARRSRSAQLLR